MRGLGPYVVFVVGPGFNLDFFYSSIHLYTLLSPSLPLFHHLNLYLLGDDTLIS